MVVDAGFIGFSHFLRGAHDFHIEGCVVACQNLDQQNPKSTRWKPKSTKIIVRECAPGPFFYDVLGQTHVNGWSHVIASPNWGSTSYIFLFRLRVLQWSRHLFNYWKNKKTIIEKFLILSIWNWIYINHRKITWLWS